MAKDTVKLIAQNRKAHHDYFFEDLYEAGIALAGTEVKSLRMGRCGLKESYIRIQNGEAWIYNLHISPYEKGNIFNKDPLRPRRLLLHKRELRKLMGSVKTDGYTIIPVRMYFRGNYAKVEIALARGKKLYDKRQDIMKKDQRRESEKQFKVKNL